MEEESDGLSLNNTKMSTKMNNAFLLAYAIYIFLSLKILTHLECIQLSQYNEDRVKVEDLAFGICESFPVSSDSETFSHQTLPVAIHTLKLQWWMC